MRTEVMKGIDASFRVVSERKASARLDLSVVFRESCLAKPTSAFVAIRCLGAVAIVGSKVRFEITFSG